ncbi:MAG: hypothetical protein AAGA53_02940 [Pseudomonadota bacterium]
MVERTECGQSRRMCLPEWIDCGVYGSGFATIARGLKFKTTTETRPDEVTIGVNHDLASTESDLGIHRRDHKKASSNGEFRFREIDLMDAL